MKVNRRHYMVIVIVMAIVTNMLMQITVSASSIPFSMEDLYTYFSGTSSSDADGVNRLDFPGWNTISLSYQKINEAIDSSFSVEQKEKERNKRELAENVILGFGKSSDYNKWKARISKLALIFDSESKEIKFADPKPSEDDFLELQSIQFAFDSALAKAEVQKMTAGDATSYDLGGLGRMLTTATGFFVSFVRALMFEIGRVGLTVGSFVFICELMFVAVEPLRPILGFKTRPITFKRHNKETGLENRVEDHGVMFQLVGKAARDAVESEFEIENMENVIKNNVVLSFLWGKIKYLVCIVGGVVLINTNIWGWLCIQIIDVGAKLFGG